MSSAARLPAPSSDPAGTPPAGAGSVVAHQGGAAHGHAHAHGRAHAHGHRGPSRREARLPGLSALRASLGVRLAVVAVLCAIMWAAILWVVA